MKGLGFVGTYGIFRQVQGGYSCLGRPLEWVVPSLGFRV